MKFPYTVIAGLFAITVIACAPDPQIITTEVTREVPVTVEVIQNIEVTREIPVTVQIQHQTEVTRIVERTREVPVTRLVEITPTAIVRQATPTAGIPVSPTLSPGAPVTPEPVATPTRMVTAPPTPTTAPDLTQTPEPSADDRSVDDRFDSWQMRPGPSQFGEVNVFHFENPARIWEAGAIAPILAYKCDSKGRRTMYIDWSLALNTQASQVPRYTDDPFLQLRDNDLDALAEMADQMLDFINEAQVHQRDISKLNQLWKSLKIHWQLDPEKSAALIREMKERNLRSVLILAGFYTHHKDHPAALKHGPTYVDELSSAWIVLPGHRTQMAAGDAGNLRRLYRNVTSAAPSGSGIDRLLIASVKQPQQVAPIMAEWEISGLGKVMGHCSVIRK